MRAPAFHKPVMPGEIISFLCLKKGFKVLDATVGLGGHAALILDKISPGGLLIGLDLDGKSLAAAEERLAPFTKAYRLVQANFADLDKPLNSLGIKKIDAALFDLGFSFAVIVKRFLSRTSDHLFSESNHILYIIIL